MKKMSFLTKHLEKLFGRILIKNKNYFLYFADPIFIITWLNDSLTYLPLLYGISADRQTTIKLIFTFCLIHKFSKNYYLE